MDSTGEREARIQLHAAWEDTYRNRPTGGTQRERQAYVNGVRDALDALADVIGLPLTEDPWDKIGAVS